MALAPKLPTNARLLQDATLVKSVALPIAANTANTGVVDLQSVTPFPTTGRIVVTVSTTASAGSANSKNVNITLQDSADNVTFANITELAAPLLRVTDSGGTTAAGSKNVSLEPGGKRYVRASAVGEANGGNAADATLTLSFNF